ncbi:MAG: aldo/keto reductase [Candidatus Thorarchaeota archaeon]|jgi:diketogulonate reductase-like aldo/keto reductase
MPILGFGTYRLPPGRVAHNAVLTALQLGYRHIDTATIYRNEQDVGNAVRESGIPREEVFVTTKLWNTDHGYKPAIEACNDSLKRLGFDYIDLYLIHWPVEDIRIESWRALETLLDQGKCRATGISNFLLRHLKNLLENCSIVPAVNQVEFNPFLYLTELLDLCQSKGIQLEGYSPLTKGRRLGDPRLIEVAEHYGKTPAQILIRWSIEHDIVAIPKSSKIARIRENADVFDFFILPEHMQILDNLDEGLRTGWDPSDVW